MHLCLYLTHLHTTHLKKIYFTLFRFFILLLLLLILPDLFIWWNFTRIQTGFWRTLLLFLPTLMALCCMLLLICQVRAATLMQLAFILLICVAVPKLVFVLADIIGRGICWHHPNALGTVHKVATALAVGMAAMQVYGTAWGWRKLQVESTTLHVAGLPAAFKGYRMVQISDIHLGTYSGDTSLMQSMVDSINQLKPDLIVFTGDMVNTASSETLPYIKILNKLHATDGIMSVLGNHDYCMYHPGLTPQEMEAEVQRIIRSQRLMGWQVLLNENRHLVRGDDTLYVAGVENVGKPPFPTRGHLDKAMKGIPPQACTLLLSHDPWHWRHGVLKQHPNIALTLSGHTHALQMQIGSFSPAAWFMPEWGGLYTEGRQQLFVSTGIGGGVPLCDGLKVRRFNCLCTLLLHSK